MPARPPQPSPIAAPALTVPLGASSSATTVDADRPFAPHMAAPAIWDDSSGTGVPDSTAVHIAHLRTLSDTRAVQSNLAAEDVASRASLTHAERSSALHLHRITSDAALLATSADAVAKIYSFIAQATDPLQHRQQRYNGQCTPGNAAALDVARIALTHGLAALHDVLPLSVLFPYGDQYGTPYFTHDDLLMDDPTAPHVHSQRTSATRRTAPSPMLLLFAVVASTIFITQLSGSATTHTALPSTSTPHEPAATMPTGPTVLPDGSGTPTQADEARAEWLTCQSLLEQWEPSAPVHWPPTRAPAARGRSLRSEAASMRCATHFTSTVSRSATPLRTLTTTTTTTRCNHHTTASPPLSRAFPATASAVMPAPCHLAGRARMGQ